MRFLILTLIFFWFSGCILSSQIDFIEYQIEMEKVCSNDYDIPLDTLPSNLEILICDEKYICNDITYDLDTKFEFRFTEFDGLILECIDSAESFYIVRYPEI